MITRCPNDQCHQTYKITAEFLGQKARCKRCQGVFVIEEFLQPGELIELPDDDQEEQIDAGVSEGGQKRRGPKDVMLEKIEIIKSELNNLLPSLQSAWKRQENESNTRLLIDRVLQKVLGYTIEDIKTEQRIEGRRADYLLSIKGEEKIVGEVKKNRNASTRDTDFSGLKLCGFRWYSLGLFDERSCLATLPYWHRRENRFKPSLHRRS